jgi:hypothetical protein
MRPAIALFVLFLGCPSDSDEPVVESDTDTDADMTWWAASGCPENQSGRTCNTAESDSVMTWHSSASTVTVSR